MSVQGANDTNGANDRTSINDEIAQQLEELDRIANSTQFNGTNLLDGNATVTAGLNFQVGANTTADDSISVTIDSALAADLGITVVPTVGGDELAAAADFQDMIGYVDDAIIAVDSIRGNLGAVQNRFESTIANLNNVSENLSASRSRILDADIAQETSNMTKQNILQQAGVSILAQANQQPQLALSLLQ